MASCKAMNLNVEFLKSIEMLFRVDSSGKLVTVCIALFSLFAHGASNLFAHISVQYTHFFQYFACNFSISH